MLWSLCSVILSQLQFPSCHLYCFLTLHALLYPALLHDNAKECDTHINVKLYWAHPLEIEMRQGTSLMSLDTWTCITHRTKGILFLLVHLPRFPSSKLGKTLSWEPSWVCALVGESQCSWASSLCLQFYSGGTRSSVLFLQEYMLVLFTS